MNYPNNYEGKEKYVEECLKPAIINTGYGWTDVKYERKVVGGINAELVRLTNANSDKNLLVTVNGDSIHALLWDVVRAIYDWGNV